MTDKLQQEIIDYVAQYSDSDAAELSGETRVDDLGIHSLELAELVMELEEKYAIEIETDTVDSWNSLKTINDIVAAVRELVAEKAG